MKQPVGGPGHCNVVVPGGEVMSTELAMKVGPWCVLIFISAIIARLFYPVGGDVPYP